MPAPAPQTQSKSKSPHIGKTNGASSAPAPTFFNNAEGPGKKSALGSILRGRGAQAKVKIGSSTDPAEAEADRVAKQVMSAAPKSEKRKPDIKTADASIKRKLATPKITEGIKEKAPPKIQKMAVPTASSQIAREADSHAQTALDNLGPGAPLPASEKQFFEPRFDQDFSNVRIHNDAASDTAARAIDARAFAMGNQIAFARGEYSPGTQAGRSLMAHELTHTVQQSAGPSQIQGKFVQREKTADNWDSAKRTEDDSAVWHLSEAGKIEQGASKTAASTSIEISEKGGHLTVPEITLPLKIKDNDDVTKKIAERTSGPQNNQPFTLDKREKKKEPVTTGQVRLRPR